MELREYLRASDTALKYLVLRRNDIDDEAMEDLEKLIEKLEDDEVSRFTLI